MSEIRETLAQLILRHFAPNEWGDWKLRPYDAADELLATFAILPLPEGKERRLTTSRRVWELPGDRGSITAYPDGTIHERTSGYWNLNEGDDVLGFAAALCAAARYASGGRILDNIQRGEQDAKDGHLTDLDDAAGEAK